MEVKLNQLALAIAAHPLRPDIEHRVALAGRTLAETLAAEGVLPGPWAISVGGIDVPAEYWARVRVKPGNLIECRAVVRKQVLQIAAIAALSYFTLGLGGIAGGAFLGLTSTVGALAAGVAFVAGSIVINKLLGPPVAKMGGGSAERAESYGLSGGRNTARPYEPLGLMLGECKVVPDLASQQFTWFEGDDQYLSCVLHAGINCGSVDSLKLGETMLSEYQGIEITHAGFPTGNDGAMPSTSVDSVAGGLLDRPDAADPAWTVRTTSPSTVRIAADIEASLTSINNEGNWQSTSVQFDAEYRLVGGDGWLPFAGGRITLANATGKPVRQTLTEDVAPGQYEVHMRKVTQNTTSTQQQNTLTWAALKSYQADTADYAGQPRVRVEVKASGQISGALDTVNWIGRAGGMPLWDGTQWVTVTEPGADGTSNPGAQLLMLMRGIRRESDGRLIAGLGLPDGKIDLDSLKAFMVRCTAKGFRFDAFIQQAMTIENLMEAIADTGYGRLSRSTGKYGVMWFAEDQPLSGVINMATMKARSFTVDYDLLPTADEGQYDFYDATAGYTQQSVRVVSPLAVTTPNRQANVSVLGTNYAEQAARRARFMLGQSAYARKSISWEMDLEYLIYGAGSLVALSHDLTQWGAGGRAVGFDRASDSWTIDLDVELPAVAAPLQVMALALPGEIQMRVYPVGSVSADRRSITVNQAWPTALPAPGEGADVLDTTWLFDIKATLGYRCRITSVQPNANMTGARITAVPEAPEFWDYVWNGAWTQPSGDSLLARMPPVASNAAISTERVRVGEAWRTELTIVFDVAGNYDHAQVWGAADGNPLVLLASDLYGTRATWYADRGQSWAIEVRPFDSLGRMGAVATVAYTVASNPPASVGAFMIGVTEQGAVASWARPAGLAGVDWSLTEVRVGASWDTAAPVFSGRADSFNLGWLVAGTTTVWASHRTTAGEWGEPASASVTIAPPGQPVIDTGRDQSAVRLEWQDCRATQPLRGYRVLQGTTLVAATLLGTVSATSYTRIESAAGLHRYWILAEDIAGNLSAAGQAQVETLPSIEGVMAQLESGLGNVLDPVTGLPALQQSLENLRDEVDESVGDLEHAVWGDVQAQPPLPLVQIAAQQDANNQQVAQHLAATADDLLASVLAWGQVKQTLTDAGIYIDASTGQVHIYGVDANAERLSQVDIDLDAVASTLTLKASTTYVDQRIAAAQLDPNGQNIFDGLDARIAAAEIEIDGVSATVQTKASLLVVDEQGGRLTTAEQTITAQGQAINQKVSTVDFQNAIGGLDTRLGDAETTLSAIGGVSTISSIVTQARGLQQQTDLQAETSLRDILNGWAEGQARNAQYASGRQEMTAKVDDGLSAQAQRIVELQALVKTADSALAAQISTEEITRAAADGALSSRVDSLTATVGSNNSTLTAALSAEQAARANADEAEAVDRRTISARLLGTTDPNSVTLPTLSSGILFDERSARTTADAAEATARQALEATVQGNYSSLSAGITAEQSARVGGDASEAVARQALSSTVLGTTTPIGVTLATLSAGILYEERNARTTSDTAQVEQITALTATVGSNQASVSGALSAITNEQQAQASQINGVTATVADHTASIATQSSAIASIDGQLSATWSLGVTAGSKVAGMVLNNSGTASSMVMLVDKFAIALDDSDSAKYPFIVGTVNGVPAVAMNTAVIGDATISSAQIISLNADKIVANSLSTMSANLGTVTAGTISNAAASETPTTLINMNATGDETFIEVRDPLTLQSTVQIQANGKGTFSREIVSAPIVLNHGVWTGAITPTSSLEFSGILDENTGKPIFYASPKGFKVYIDTGVPSNLSWGSAGTETCIALAKINGGTSNTGGGMNGYGRATVVLGQGLVSGSSHPWQVDPIQDRYYILFEWDCKYGDVGDTFTVNFIDWKLLKV